MYDILLILFAHQEQRHGAKNLQCGEKRATIFIGVWLFHDVIGWRGVLGYSIVFTGVVLYKFLHQIEKRHPSNHPCCDDKQNCPETSAKVPLLVNSGSND